MLKVRKMEVLKKKNYFLVYINVIAILTRSLETVHRNCRVFTLAEMNFYNMYDYIYICT